MQSAPSLVRRIEHRGNDGLITTGAAEAKYSVSARKLARLADSGKVHSRRHESGKGPRLFVEADIAELAAKRELIESVSAVGMRLGIPPQAVRDLGAAGLITAETGPVIELVMGNEYYVSASVDDLISRILSAVKGDPAPPNRLRLPRAMNRLPPGDKPWAAVVRAIVGGDLEVFQVNGYFTTVLPALAVAEFEPFLAAIKNDCNIGIPSSTCTRAEAAMILGISVPSTIAFMQQGHIDPPVEVGGPLDRGSVQVAAKKWIFTTEVSARSNVGVRFVRPRLERHGIEPAFIADPMGRGLGYLRHQVEPVIKKLRKKS